MPVTFVTPFTSHVSRVTQINWAPPSPPAGVRKLRRQSGSGPGALGLRYRSLSDDRQAALRRRPGICLLAVSNSPVGTCLLAVSLESAGVSGAR